MSEDISRRKVVGAADGGCTETELQERLDFQSLDSNSRRRSRSMSQLTILSLFSALVGGPVGALAAIVFAWAAQNEPQGSGRRPSRTLPITGMVLGFLSTSVWAAVIASTVVSLEKQLRLDEETRTAANDVVADDPVSTRVAVPQAPRVELVEPVPTTTTTRHEGSVIVIDVGTLVPSLSEELARQRVDASRQGDLLLVMTTRKSSASCRNFTDQLRHPLMQTALARVRIVRVDVDAFEEDLSNLKFPHERLPGFFLLAPDLFPLDGIDAEEWPSDTAATVAPVLGSFVRGKYALRRRSWQPVAENRLRL